MSILESVVLGLIQGVTEFLPISSSGHLIIARRILHLPLEGSLILDIILNTATLISVLYVFRRYLWSIIHDFMTEGLSTRNINLLLALIIGTIPAALLGFFLGDKIENTFRSVTAVAIALIIGSGIMYFANREKARGGVTPLKGFIVGIFQSLALIPGISRSGSSISGGVISGLSREEAFRFSFLLYIPVSFGAALKAYLDMHKLHSLVIINFPLVLSFLIALFTGVVCLRYLMNYFIRNSFTPFIIYRLALAAAILIFL